MKSEKKVNFKQRIIGAIVIVSLAIIILPILLRPHENIEQQIKIEKMPAVPSTIKKIVNQYDKSVNQVKTMPALPVSGSLPMDDENKKQVEKTNIEMAGNSHYKNALRPKDKNINQAYSIQLGSFSQSDNAFKLRDKLRAKKYKAYIEKVKMSGALGYRVRVGPYLKYDSAESTQKSIQRIFNINGRIVIYK